MRVLIGALLLGLCVVATHRRLEDWRSDQALFAAAVRVTPDHPRPALNYGTALTRLGDVEAGCQWARRAQALAVRRGDHAVAQRAAALMTWIDTVYGSCSE